MSGGLPRETRYGGPDYGLPSGLRRGRRARRVALPGALLVWTWRATRAMGASRRTAAAVTLRAAAGR